MLKGFLKARRSPKVSNEMKYYKWKDDMKYPGYEPEQLCAQG